MNIETVIADATKYAKLIEPAFALVGLAASLTGVGGPTAVVAIRVLDAAVKAIAGVADGSITKDEALADLAQYQAMLRTGDAAADAALAARFPTVP